jgi:hypothetical protein
MPGARTLNYRRFMLHRARRIRDCSEDVQRSAISQGREML